MDTAKTMERVSRPETRENHEFSKSVIFFGTFLEAQNRLNGAARGPKNGPDLFSGTPQYVRLKRELPKWSGGRDRWGAPRFSRLTKKFPPRGKYLPILPD